MKFRSKEAIEAIFEAVCSFYSMTKEEAREKSRRRNIAQVRHIAMALCKEHLRQITTNAEIAEQIANQGHCSAIHAAKAVNDRLDTEKMFCQRYFAIREITKEIAKPYLEPLQAPKGLHWSDVIEEALRCKDSVNLRIKLREIKKNYGYQKIA